MDYFIFVGISVSPPTAWSVLSDLLPQMFFFFLFLKDLEKNTHHIVILKQKYGDV